MKNAILWLIALMLLAATPMAYADSAKDQQKERKELAKSAKSLLNEKASKESRQEAKQYVKEGWKTTPGSLSIEKQLDRAKILKGDPFGTPEYIMATGKSVGTTYDAARMQAITVAKQEIVRQTESDIAGLVEDKLSNGQLSSEDAASITEITTTSKEKFGNKLGRVIPVMELYREVGNKNTEVLIELAYSVETARSIAKEEIIKRLRERGDALSEKIDDLFD